MQMDPAHTAPVYIDPRSDSLAPEATTRAGGARRTPSGTPARSAPFAPPRRASSDTSSPPVAEIAEDSLVLFTGIMVGGPALPGLLFCVPGLLFFIVPALVLVIVPVVALGLVAAAAGLVVVLVAVPVRVGWRVGRRLPRALDGRRAPRVLMAPQRRRATGP